MIMDMKGLFMLGGKKPTIDTLLQFLIGHPNYIPMVNVNAHSSVEGFLFYYNCIHNLDFVI